MNHVHFSKSSLFILFSIATLFNISAFASGKDTAIALNNRYMNKQIDCNGKPAYTCTGIVLRSNEGRGYSWNVSLGSIEKEKFSTSFIRSDLDVGVNGIYYFDHIGYGILLKTSQQKEYFTRCIFPVNGFTNTNSDHGCGAPVLSHKIDEDNSNCRTNGITTAEDWIAATAYSSDVPCSFNSHSVSEFNEALKAQNLHFEKYKLQMWNELILNTSSDSWDSNLVANGLVEALFFNRSADGINDLGGTYTRYGLTGAQTEQQKYHELTGEWIPVIEINAGNHEAPFSYSDLDQAIPEIP